MGSNEHFDKTAGKPGHTGGFTLIEMAIVLLIVTLLLGGLLMPLSAQLEQHNTSETQKLLEDAKEALIGFALANGRLPCPAAPNSVDGLESFTSTGNTSNGICSNFFDGLLPAATLGITPVDNNGLALDAWGLKQNRIRYAISNLSDDGGASYVFTKVDGMKTATDGIDTGMSYVGKKNLLYICASGTGITAADCGTAQELTHKTLIVVYSVGENAATGGTGIDEAANPNPNSPNNDQVFVSHPQSATAGNEFDDLVTWLSPNILFNRMVAAGRLP